MIYEKERRQRLLIINVEKNKDRGKNLVGLKKDDFGDDWDIYIEALIRYEDALYTRKKTPTLDRLFINVCIIVGIPDEVVNFYVKRLGRHEMFTTSRSYRNFDLLSENISNDSIYNYRIKYQRDLNVDTFRKHVEHFLGFMLINYENDRLDDERPKPAAMINTNSNKWLRKIKRATKLGINKTEISKFKETDNYTGLCARIEEISKKREQSVLAKAGINKRQ